MNILDRLMPLVYICKFIAWVRLIFWICLLKFSLQEHIVTVDNYARVRTVPLQSPLHAQLYDNHIGLGQRVLNDL